MNDKKEIKAGTKLLAYFFDNKPLKCTVTYAHVDGKGFDVQLEDGRKYGLPMERVIEVLGDDK